MDWPRYRSIPRVLSGLPRQRITIRLQSQHQVRAVQIALQIRLSIHAWHDVRLVPGKPELTRVLVNLDAGA